MLVLLGLVFYTILKEEDTSSILDALKDASIFFMFWAAIAGLM